MYNGRMLRTRIFGESHGVGVGVLLEGVPPGLPVSEELIARELAKRRPGSGGLVSPRREPDEPRILSGVFNGYTTGAPIAVFIWNKDVDSSYYEEIRYRPRPGHADLAGHYKYWGFRDYRGGGINSGRLTAGVVAGGAIARVLLERFSIRVYAFIRSISGVESPVEPRDDPRFEESVYSSPVRSPGGEDLLVPVVEEARRSGDSVGGVVEAWIYNAPIGLGEPPMEGLDSALAGAMLSIPGAKGFELGAGFTLASMRGSEALDTWSIGGDGRPFTLSNHMGGVNGGMSNGMPIVFRVAFKPTSTILREQETIDLERMEPARIRPRGRHDPCIAIRATAVVENMARLVIGDYLLRWTAWEGMRSRILGGE